VDRQAERLRELHETYVWKVNAAVGEGRDDLVWRLVDEYADRALRLMTAEQGTACGRPDCAMCHRPAPPARPPAGWFRRLFPGR
jgi:hypothetical protein